MSSQLDGETMKHGIPTLEGEEDEERKVVTRLGGVANVVEETEVVIGT